MSGGLVVGHNIGGFEVPVWNNFVEHKKEWPWLEIDQCQDTMAQAYAMGLPGSLDGAAIAMGIEKQKDMKGHRIMLQLSQPKEVKDDGSIVWWNDDEKLQKLFDYCKTDVEVERELYLRMPKLSPAETALWRLDHRINRRGIAIDTRRASAANAIVDFEKDRLDSEMRRLTENAVATCTATGQLNTWFKWQGIEIDGVAKSHVTELLAKQDLPPLCRQVLLLRQEAAKASNAKLLAMVNRAGGDSRMRGTTQYHGAATGRWAGRGAQVQNFPRPNLSNEEIESVFKILGEIDV
jgi:DNA polymerase